MPETLLEMPVKKASKMIDLDQIVEQMSKRHSPMVVTSTNGTPVFMITDSLWRGIFATAEIESDPELKACIFESKQHPLSDKSYWLDEDEVEW